MEQPAVLEYELAPAQFERITALLQAYSGIRLRKGKEGLVRARLVKRLRALGLRDFGAYLEIVDSGGDDAEFAEMIDALTTNMTSFFRESAHFDFLRTHVLPHAGRNVRVWSAGCATGQEPYTLAMLLADAPGGRPRASGASILATDINERVLAIARAGRYDAELLSTVPLELRQRFWTRHTHDARDVYTASPSLRRQVEFARLNLMDAWPMEGQFDVILCRNVMIYFDKPTQQVLVERFWRQLPPGGRLLVGHSESLSGLSHRFRYVMPAVYEK